MSTDAAYAQDEVFTIKLSRNESGLGLVFDSDFVVTKLHPGCAAERHGGVHIGDTLLAVDGVELHPGDRVGALFPMHVPTFELRLLRASGVSGIPKAMPASKGDVAPTKKPRRMHHAQRVASRREQSGKFEASRPAPVFQEVVWNEYCVLFPDGSSAPFNEVPIPLKRGTSERVLIRRPAERRSLPLCIELCCALGCAVGAVHGTYGLPAQEAGGHRRARRVGTAPRRVAAWLVAALLPPVDEAARMVR